MRLFSAFSWIFTSLTATLRHTIPHNTTLSNITFACAPSQCVCMKPEVNVREKGKRGRSEHLSTRGRPVPLRICLAPAGGLPWQVPLLPPFGHWCVSCCGVNGHPVLDASWGTPTGRCVPLHSNVSLPTPLRCHVHCGTACCSHIHMRPHGVVWCCQTSERGTGKEITDHTGAAKTCQQATNGCSLTRPLHLPRPFLT